MAQSISQKDLQPWIGKHLETKTYRVTAEDIKRWAYITDSLNPLWLDEQYAKTTSWGGIIAPPTFAMSPYDVLPISQYPEDGQFTIGPDVGLNRKIAGGIKWRFFKPIRPGDTITEDTLIEDMRLQDGQRSGPMIVWTTLTKFTNQHGETVAERRFVHIRR